MLARLVLILATSGLALFCWGVSYAFAAERDNSYTGLVLVAASFIPWILAGILAAADWIKDKYPIMPERALGVGDLPHICPVVDDRGRRCVYGKGHSGQHLFKEPWEDFV